MIGGQGNCIYFDLESSVDQQRLQNPELVLGALKGLVIIDEIQIQPSLFNTLRVLVDKAQSTITFLILGSASPHIIRSVSETLAGRVEFVELTEFNAAETGPLDKLWLRGGFPPLFWPKHKRIAWHGAMDLFGYFWKEIFQCLESM